MTEGIPFCSVCKKQNRHIEPSEKCIQCNNLNHKECAKISQNELNRDAEYLCTECLAENFPLANISSNGLLENTCNSNFICQCLNRKGKLKCNHINHMLLKLKDLNFSKIKYAQNDSDDNLTDSTNFGF